MKKLIFLILITAQSTLAAQDVKSIPATVESVEEAPKKPEKEYNIRFYPLNIFAGGMRIDGLKKVSDSWLLGLGAERIKYDYGLFKRDAWGVGITSLYAFGKSPFVDGWYMAPEFMYRAGRVGVDYVLIGGESDFQAYQGALTFGYHWHGPSFNFTLGIGPSVSHIVLKDLRGRTILFGGEFTSDQPGAEYSDTYFGVTGDIIMGFAF